MTANVIEGESNDDGATSSFTRKQKLALVMLATADFMCYCSMSIMAPFYPKQASEKGMTETTSGFVFSFYSLVIFVSSPLFGKIMPKVGVKNCFTVGIIVSGFCSIVFGTIIYIDDYATFTALSFIIRGVEALGSSAYCTASYVLVSHIFPNHAGFVRGVLEIFVGLGLSAGPALGGLLFAIGGFGMPFYVMGLIIISLAPLNKCLIPKRDITKEELCGSFKSILKLPSVVLASLIIVVICITWSFLYPTLEPHLRKYDLSSYTLGLFFLLLSGTYGISSPIAGWLGDRMDNFWLLMVGGMFFSGVSLLILGPSRVVFFLTESVWWDIGALSILGVCNAVALLPTYRAILDGALCEGRFEDNLGTQGLVAGLWSSMYSLGEVIGPVSGGALFNNFGFAVTVEVVALINFIMAAIALVYFFHRRKIIKGDQKVRTPTPSKGNYSFIDTEMLALDKDVDR